MSTVYSTQTIQKKYLRILWVNVFLEKIKDHQTKQENIGESQD